VKAGGTHNEKTIDASSLGLCSQNDKYPLVKLRISLVRPEAYISIFMFANLSFTSEPSGLGRWDREGEAVQLNIKEFENIMI